MLKDLAMSSCSNTDDVVSNFFECLKGFTTGFTLDILVTLLQELGDRLLNLGEIHTWCTDVGGFQSKTSRTLLGSTAIPSGDITWLKNDTLLIQNSHLLNFV
jgi:hypothetical protein